ncbi:hypothetical protein LG299_12685 [Microbacterium lacus]|uniref:hypothetical protein n=1 Tax=Microbacterium lacus TaxID=415217 RepID=UPI00384B62E7
MAHPAVGYAPVLAEFLPLLSPTMGDAAYWIERGDTAVVHLSLPTPVVARRTSRSIELTRWTQEQRSAEAAESKGEARVHIAGGDNDSPTWAFLRIDDGPWIPADEVGGFDASAWEWDVYRDMLRIHMSTLVSKDAQGRA